MPTYNSLIGYGADYLMSTDQGATYNSVGEVVDFDAPDLKVNDVKTSYLQMANRWHRFMPGIGDAGDSKFRLIFNKTVFNTLLLQFFLTNYWKIVFPDLVSTASVWIFQGFINGVGQPVKLDEEIVFDISIKVTGAPAFTPGS